MVVPSIVMISVARFFSGFSKLVSSGNFPKNPQEARRNIKKIIKRPTPKKSPKHFNISILSFWFSFLFYCFSLSHKLFECFFLKTKSYINNPIKIFNACNVTIIAHGMRYTNFIGSFFCERNIFFIP